MEKQDAEFNQILEVYMCPLCSGNQSCSARHTKGYHCTREEGHSGPHAACGCRRNSHPIVEWED